MTNLQIAQTGLIFVFIVITVVFYISKKRNPHWAYKWMFNLGCFMILVATWTVLAPIVLKGNKALLTLNFYLLNIIYPVAAILVFLKIIKKKKSQWHVR